MGGKKKSQKIKENRSPPEPAGEAGSSPVPNATKKNPPH